MADMPAEDALNNNDTVKRYIVRLQRRKVKRCWTKSFFKFLKHNKTRIWTSILCLALITAIFLKIHSQSLPPKKPNITKKHDVELKPAENDHAGKNVNKLQREVFYIREKQCILEDTIKLTQRKFKNVRADIKQDGGYVNTKQANKMIHDALELYDVCKGGVIDYACLYTGLSILAPPDTYNLPLSDYEFFGLHSRIIYSQPTDLITPDVTPEHRFAFWGNNGRVQMAISQKIYIIAVTMENALEAVIGDQIILTPRIFAVYGFEDPHQIKLTEIDINHNIDKETFAIPKGKQTMAFACVELRILDNHGNEDLSCVYCVPVYGVPH